MSFPIKGKDKDKDNSVAKFAGMQKVLDFLPLSVVGRAAALSHMAVLGVCEDKFAAYDGSDPISEMIGVDEIMEVMRANRLRIDNTCEDTLKKEMKERAKNGISGAKNPKVAGVEKGSEKGTDGLEGK